MNNDSISPICQFKYQLSDLFDTFRWIPQSDQTAALLAVEDFLIKLKQFCSYQETDSNDGCETLAPTYNTEKPSDKIFANLVPLHTFDMLNAQPRSDTAVIEQANQALPFDAFKTNSRSDLGIIQQTECSPMAASSTSPLSSSCTESNAPFSELENATLDTVMASLPCNADMSIAINNGEPVVEALSNIRSSITCESSRIKPAFLQLVPYTNLVHNISAAQFETSTKETESAVESVPCDVQVTLNHLQNNHGERPSPENQLVFLDMHSERLQSNYSEAPMQESYCDKNGEKSVAPSTAPFGRVTRSMARGTIKRRKAESHNEPPKKPKAKKKRLSFLKDNVANSKNSKVNVCLGGSNDSNSTPHVDVTSGLAPLGERKLGVDIGQSVCQLLSGTDGSNPTKKISYDRCHSSIPSQVSFMPNLVLASLGPVSCRHCRSEFESLEALTKHSCKPGQMFWTCKQCNLTFNQLQLFQKHQSNHKRNDCKICDARFTKRKALSKHSKLEHGVVEPERYYHCPYCERKFIKRPSLYTHLKEHADSKIVCMKCGLMCDSEELYNQHMLKHTEEAKFRCDKCNESFLRRQQYEQHMGCHNKYDCTLCDTNFSTKKQMIKHKRLVHGIRTREEKRHECKLCAKKFRRPTLLEIHMRVHTGEKPVQCAHCDKKFRTPKSLTRHLKTTTHLKACGQSEELVSEMDKSFLCAQCGAKFYRKQGLSRHMQQLHSEERPYECQFCDYKCKCKTNLKRHIELHKDERRFVCELCGASFHAHATLKEHHAYVHSDVRGFVCPNCGKGFKGRSGLRRHIRSHSDARPYVCYCGQSYKRMSHLKRHMSAIHALAFKSKRVQRISADNPPSSLLEDSNSSAAFPVLQPSIGNMCLDSVLPSETVALPVSNTDGLLIIDDPKHSTGELTRSMAFEVTTQTVADEVIAHLQISPDASPLAAQALPSMGTQIPLTISSASQSPDAGVGPLPSISETAELRRAFDLSGVTVPVAHSNITVSIPTTCPPPSLPPQLPLLQSQSMYHAIQPVTPTPLSITTSPEIQSLECQQALQALPPEFYTQSLAQFLSM